ncbi:MAG: hypothetical protein DI539_24905, partial [Flavobacterium psychrophilum]
MEQLMNGSAQELYESINSKILLYASSKSITELFAETAAESPDKIAVCTESKKHTYAELSNRANQFANWLIGMGIVRETPVAIYLSPSFESIAAILGILRAGGAYVPLPTSCSIDSLIDLLDQVKSPLLIFEVAYLSQVNKLQWSCPQLKMIASIDSDDFYSNIEIDDSMSQKELWEYISLTGRDDIGKGGWINSYNRQPF